MTDQTPEPDQSSDIQGPTPPVKPNGSDANSLPGPVPEDDGVSHVDPLLTEEEDN